MKCRGRERKYFTAVARRSAVSARTWVRIMGYLSKREEAGDAGVIDSAVPSQSR